MGSGNVSEIYICGLDCLSDSTRAYCLLNGPGEVLGIDLNTPLLGWISEGRYGEKQTQEVSAERASDRLQVNTITTSSRVILDSLREFVDLFSDARPYDKTR